MHITLRPQSAFYTNQSNLHRTSIAVTQTYICTGQHLQSPPHILQTGLFSQSAFPQQNPIPSAQSKKLWQETAEVQTDSAAYPTRQKEKDAQLCV